MNTCQGGTSIECLNVHACNFIGDSDTRQRVAMTERLIANTRDAIAYGDTRQRVARTERILANARDAIGDNKLCN